jgi:TRAP-type C4-dicarboxylate transport system substrate-binding protein
VLPLSDVLTGLQTGLLDVIVTPPVGALLLQWYTKVKYINPLPVAYTLGLLALDQRAFGRISPEDQAVLTEVMNQTYLRLDEINRRDNIEAEEALLANGIQVAVSDPEDIPYWSEIANKTNREIWDKTAVNPALYDELMALLADYRAAPVAGEVAADNGM